MKNRIKARILAGKTLTEAQVAWAENELGKYDDGCDLCLFNLMMHLGIEPPSELSA